MFFKRSPINRISFTYHNYFTIIGCENATTYLYIVDYTHIFDSQGIAEIIAYLTVFILQKIKLSLEGQKYNFQ